MNKVLEFSHPSDPVAVIFDDDGRVAYAYMRRMGKLVSDVWLYNRDEAPSVPEWNDGPDKMPFLNPARFVRQEKFIPVTSKEEVGVVWFTRESEICAELFIRGTLHARICTGQTPGECVLALKSGPLARVLS